MNSVQVLQNAESDCVPVVRCRICKNTDLRSVLDLGNQCIASVFVRNTLPKAYRQAYPLELVRCTGAHFCGLVQLRHSLSPALLYSDYGYRSGINESMRENLQDIVAKASAMTELEDGDAVLDIGCNDGTLLGSYPSTLQRIGIDPAEKLVEVARAQGFEVINDYFSAAAVHRERPGLKAKIITSIAMFYDLEDPCQFAADAASLLHPNGVWVVELSYLPTMLARNSFDTVCHEHLEYYGLRQLEWIANSAGLVAHKFELNDVNGGSIRVFLRHKAFGRPGPEAERELAHQRETERFTGLEQHDTYVQFRNRVEGVRSELLSLLHSLKAQGKRVYIYGASTKGNTILQMCGINQQLITKAADRNPDKWGRRLLGSDIPIVSEDEARGDQPDFFLVLPWHFMDVFVKREADFLKSGGAFIVPLPHVHILRG